MTTIIVPGRVNLIGDHTDYVGGLAMPCAIDLGITAEVEPSDGIDLTTDATAEHGSFTLPLGELPDDSPTWIRLVHTTARLAPNMHGATGRFTTTLPIGAGLSSSAACTIALALALGAPDDKRELVLLAQAIEQQATGVPCGVLDQLAIVFGEAGHALIVDAAAVEARPTHICDGVGIVVVPSGSHRALSETPYAERRAQAEQAVREMGGLAGAALTDALSIPEPVLRRRARHVITENARVLAMATAFTSNDARAAGQLLLESHASLKNDAEVSTKGLDQLVDALSSRPGVFGARLTGAGFGGSVVVLTEGDAAHDIAQTFGGRVVSPSAGARVL